MTGKRGGWVRGKQSGEERRVRGETRGKATQQWDQGGGCTAAGGGGREGWWGEDVGRRSDGDDDTGERGKY